MYFTSAAIASYTPATNIREVDGADFPVLGSKQHVYQQPARKYLSANKMKTHYKQEQYKASLRLGVGNHHHAI